jgi:hypothetical protein
MVWGCFGYEGTGPLSVVTGTMNAAKYMATLNAHLLPQMNQWHPAGNGIFQQDNAPCHKALCVTQMLNNAGVQVIAWPPYSPDLSPIENLWAIVKQKVHVASYVSKEALVERIQDIWTNDLSVKEACKSLIESMPQRINACIAAKGGVIKY